jgi:hypothetical protein
LRKECRLRVFKNKVLRRIFGPKRDEVTGEWRRLHYKELYALYSSPHHSGDQRGAYRVLVGKPEGRRPLGRPRRIWENNIKMDLREVGWGGAWTGSIWLRTRRDGELL